MKAAEAKARDELSKIKVTASIKEVRRRAWYEKFQWFLSSDRILVIAGHDAQQNELVVKRHLREGDAYVHADIHGAASCVIKNPDRTKDIPPRTLAEAGSFCVCLSSAWNAKVVTSAWWVQANQVSKTAPTGEYLTTGAFMIRGKKNFLPHNPLVMGFGYLFKLEESCVARHLPQAGTSEASFTETDTQTDTGTEQDAANLAAIEGEDDSELEDEVEEETAQEPAAQETQAQEEVDASKDSEDQRDGNESQEGSGEEHSDDDNALDFGISGLRTSSLGSSLAARSDKALQKDSKNEAESDHEEGSEATANKGSKPSAKERKLMKKTGLSLQEVRAAEQQRSAEKPTPAPQPIVETKPIEAVPRGKRTKLKRAKAKYKDQDETEREVRLQILQSAGPKAEATDATDKKENKQTAAPPPAAEPEDATENQKIAFRERMSRAQKTALRHQEAREIREILKDENLDQVDENLNDLLTFTGKPFDDDVCLYCVPMCGPYLAMSSFKFKVKLTPGTQRKGKAGKQAIEIFMRSATSRERELIKGVGDNEVLETMIANVTLSVPGLQSFKQAKKNQKKKSKGAS
eukprot:c20289_g1_i1.p1 GENE.c20289_g1_i1~~c20289_g1_i1.p1  ORF type:complete len:577 (+),score=172.14 c20289_g1_i1:1333-3063(+)